MMQFIDLARQQARLKPQLDAAIARVLAHGHYILGPEVEELEDRLGRLTGRHCITVANGTDALTVALMALGVGPGDEVIVPAFSYIATAEAAALLGARPVYVDIDPQRFTLNPAQLVSAITRRTRAIIAVSLYGQPADFASIGAIADAYGIPVIEDAAQSFGAKLGAQPSCALSSLACTSFFPTKPLGCYGDGGAIFAEDPELAARILQIARHGQAARYHHVRLGVNSRLDTIQAAVLLTKLDCFEADLMSRARVAAQYDAALQGLDLTPPQLAHGITSAWAQYTIRLRQRDIVKARLDAAGIPTVVHYPLPLHRQPATLDQNAAMPESDQAADEVLSLPMHPDLTEAEIAQVAEALGRALNQREAAE